jgi:hypothetical protein
MDPEAHRLLGVAASRRERTMLTRSSHGQPTLRSMRDVITPLVNGTRAIEVAVVRTSDCHLCEDAIEALETLGKTHALEVRVVKADSAEGRAIWARHRPPLFPAVLLDGRLFSSGRLPRKKLQRMLERVI